MQTEVSSGAWEYGQVQGCVWAGGGCQRVQNVFLILESLAAIAALRFFF